ncbi:MAG: hypothetical protein FWH08_02475 [Oscillospiraceae bacterium]|nr:hypothetical protein [Oscillospiraceae bacterium]
MKNVLIISDSIREINRLRRFFDSDFKVSATNSAESAVNVLQGKTTDITIFHTGTDLSRLFEFYKQLRQNAATENLPLIVLADASILKTLVDTVEMKNAAVTGTSITSDNMKNLINSFFV